MAFPVVSHVALRAHQIVGGKLVAADGEGVPAIRGAGCLNIGTLSEHTG